MVFDHMTLLIAAAFVMAGIVKGTVGIGLPTIAVGLTSQFLPPHLAIALVVFPILFSNIWQIVRTWRGFQILLKYWLLVVLLILSLWVTTFYTASVPADALLIVIGIVIVIYAVTSLLGPLPTIPDHRDRIAQTATGVSAGILGGLTSIWSPPLVSYLLARRTERDEFVQATGLCFFVGSIPLAIGFWQAGLLDGSTAPMSAMMIVPTLIGFSLGEIIRRRLQPERFRQVVLWVFLLMGLNLLRRAIF
ncbi:MAG: sulfite exporter TauE/SafE family protein [Pseudomonadota bacterium]